MASCISASLYRATRAAARNRTLAKQAFTLVRLTKAGVPSKMHDAASSYYTEADALEAARGMRRMNPSLVLRFELNGVEI